MPERPDDLAVFHGSALLEAIRQAVGNASIGLAVTLSDHDPPRNLYLNEQAEELMGRSREEVERIGVWACLAPDQLAMFEERRARRERGETVPPRYETVLMRPNGELVPIEVTHSQTSIGGHVVTVSFLFDARDRKRAVKALEESERRFRHVVENAPDGVVVLRGPKIVFLNPQAARLLGITRPEDGVGRIVTELIHPEDAARAAERIGRIARTGQPLPESVEYRSRNVEGREVSVEISSIPIELEGERAIVAFARDVTERKAIQNKLVQADRMAALGVLSAGVAHEINNPLAYVLLNLEYLARELGSGSIDPSRSEALMARVRDAQHGAERVASIVRDLRTFTRGDEGNRGPVHLNVVIDAALNIAGGEIQRRAQVLKEYEEVPPVEGNANRLEQVFLNLLLNAAQAIEAGNADANEIRVRIHRHGAGVQAVIEDTGTGMSQDVKAKIFDPFFTTKPPGVGTGLGLPICQSIVRSHGGEIGVESTSGKGSRFSVTLPSWQGKLESADPAVDPSSSKPRAPRGRVLIVDDEVAVGRTLRLVLESEHDITVVTSAEEALERLDRDGSERFDVVLCDLVMPGMTGLDLLKVLQKLHPRLAARVIFMTGGLTSRRSDDLASLPNRLFEKPFDLEQLRRALRDVLHSGTAEIRQTPSA